MGRGEGVRWGGGRGGEVGGRGGEVGGARWKVREMDANDARYRRERKEISTQTKREIGADEDEEKACEDDRCTVR